MSANMAWVSVSPLLQRSWRWVLNASRGLPPRGGLIPISGSGVGRGHIVGRCRGPGAGGGRSLEDFHVDWQAETVTCPQGTVSPTWKPTVADGKPRLSVLFRRADYR